MAMTSPRRRVLHGEGCPGGRRGRGAVAPWRSPLPSVSAPRAHDVRGDAAAGVPFAFLGGRSRAHSASPSAEFPATRPARAGATPPSVISPCTRSPAVGRRCEGPNRGPGRVARMAGSPPPTPERQGPASTPRCHVRALRLAGGRGAAPTRSPRVFPSARGERPREARHAQGVGRYSGSPVLMSAVHLESGQQRLGSLLSDRLCDAQVQAGESAASRRCGAAVQLVGGAERQSAHRHPSSQRALVPHAPASRPASGAPTTALVS